MRVLSLPIVIALSVLGCETGTPVAPTRGVSDEVDTTPPPATPPGPTVARPAFKVMTYNVQLANVGAPNPASRKPMIVEIIRSEAPDIVGLQELGSTHRADIEAGLQDLYDVYDGGSVRNAELILLRKNVLAGSGQGMVTLSTQCGGSLGVTFLEVRSLRGVDFVVFNTHLCFTNPARSARHPGHRHAGRPVPRSPRGRVRGPQFETGGRHDELPPRAGGAPGSRQSCAAL